jgi:hypothetical protein
VPKLQGHLESLAKESKESPLDRIVPKLSMYVSGTVDWQYLYQARCVLLECRRVLSNAYVFSFFMFEPANFAQVRFTGHVWLAWGLSACRVVCFIKVLAPRKSCFFAGRLMCILTS